MRLAKFFKFAFKGSPESPIVPVYEKARDSILASEEFFIKASKYREDLASVTGFDAIYRLWQQTSIPYNLVERNPQSEAYKKEVLAIYERLASISYSTANEMTSTLQPCEEEFEAGYPWTSKNLHVVSQETAKVAQALNALGNAGMSGKRIIEFGSGWGNLAVPLAKAGQDVTVVDIDLGFLSRIERICQRERIKISSIHSEFLNACKKTDGQFDAIIFQASFHHCLDFDILLHQIRSSLLTDQGRIFFFSEPIFERYAFPWGIRYDGESLWAVMCNKWLELGFDQSFFSEVLLVNGFFLQRIPGVTGFVGDGWQAVQSANGIQFKEWILPSVYETSFHNPDHGSPVGRFCKRKSTLPALSGEFSNSYRISFYNYCPHRLNFSIKSGDRSTRYSISSEAEMEISVASDGSDVVIDSEIFQPYTCISGNADTRELGVYISHVTASCQRNL